MYSKSMVYAKTAKKHNARLQFYWAHCDFLHNKKLRKCPLIRKSPPIELSHATELIENPSSLKFCKQCKQASVAADSGKVPGTTIRS